MFPGNGYKIANDVLTDISYVLVEPVVSTKLGTVVAAGTHTVTPASMASIYVGAMVIVGTGSAEEVVTVTAATGTTFTAVFAFAHAATDAVIGATFPVGQPDNPFFTQAEMLSYLTSAENNYLTEVPLIYNRAAQAFISGQTAQPIPADCVEMERVAVNGYALYEQGQTSLDLLNYRWNAAGFNNPETWHQDRVNFQTYGVQPVPGNAFSADVIYVQREAGTLALNEGFLLPDPFLTYVKYGTLAWAFDKDGEMRDITRAKYCLQRVEMGVKIGLKYYENVVAQAPTGDMQHA